MQAYEAEPKRLLTAFAATLRALRREDFPRQEELAHAASFTAHTGFIEQGMREPSLSTLSVLSTV